MFNLYNKIQIINPGFRLYFCSKTKSFVIVNIYRNFEICKEFYAFFENIENDLRFSKIENFNQIIKNLDEENYKNITRKTDEVINTLSSTRKEFAKVSSRSTTILQSDINKIIGAAKC